MKFELVKTTRLLGLWLWLWMPTAGAFELSNLPVGKSVTLPRPALTLVPVSASVKLTATDHQQTIKLSSVAKQGPSIKLKIAIYDSLSDRVRYVELKPGGSVLYSFRGLNTIRLVPMVPKAARASKFARLQVESNRPMGIGR